MYLFLVVLGLQWSLDLHCCVWLFCSCGEQGLLLVAVHGLSLWWLHALDALSSVAEDPVVAGCGL